MTGDIVAAKQEECHSYVLQIQHRDKEETDTHTQKHMHTRLLCVHIFIHLCIHTPVPLLFTSSTYTTHIHKHIQASFYFRSSHLFFHEWREDVTRAYIFYKQFHLKLLYYINSGFKMRFVFIQNKIENLKFCQIENLQKS